MSSTASSEDKGVFQRIWPQLKGFIAGYGSGMALIAVGHPFDTVKVRLQTDTTGRFKGPINCVAETFRKEGVRGFYRGVTPPLFATGIINSGMFGMQGIFTKLIKKDKDKPPTTKDVAISAIFSGSLISFVVCPIEGVKARLQVQYNSFNAPAATATAAAAATAANPAQRIYKGPIDCATHVVKTLGVRKGLYRGFGPTVFCRLSNYAYFGPYEYVRHLLVEDGPNGERKLSLMANAMAGASAGVCYWLSCYPMDVVKNRMQAAPDVLPPKYPTARYTAQVIYREGGWKAFYKGFTPALVRAVPANIACFSAFEIIMYLLP